MGSFARWSTVISPPSMYELHESTGTVTFALPLFVACAPLDRLATADFFGRTIS